MQWFPWLLPVLITVRTQYMSHYICSLVIDLLVRIFSSQVCGMLFCQMKSYQLHSFLMFLNMWCLFITDNISTSIYLWGRIIFFCCQKSISKHNLITTGHHRMDVHIVQVMFVLVTQIINSYFVNHGVLDNSEDGGDLSNGTAQ